MRGPLPKDAPPVGQVIRILDARFIAPSRQDSDENVQVILLQAQSEIFYAPEIVNLNGLAEGRHAES